MLVGALFVFSLAYAHGFRVHTTEGIVEGTKPAVGDYYAFYGIPYAGPTAGVNRFKVSEFNNTFFHSGSLPLQ